MQLSNEDIETIISDTNYTDRQEIEEGYDGGTLDIYLNEQEANKDIGDEYSRIEKTLLPSGKVAIYYD